MPDNEKKTIIFVNLWVHTLIKKADVLCYLNIQIFKNIYEHLYHTTKKNYIAYLPLFGIYTCLAFKETYYFECLFILIMSVTGKMWTISTFNLVIYLQLLRNYVKLCTVYFIIKNSFFYGEFCLAYFYFAWYIVKKILELKCLILLFPGIFQAVSRLYKHTEKEEFTTSFRNK